MLSRLLGKTTKRKPGSADALGGFEVDESIDLDSGTIYIDDTIDPERVVATSHVYAEADISEERTSIAGGGAKIFAFDLRPFFRAIGAKPGERSADTFTRFCENQLSRSVGPAGAYEFDGLEFFFFRLDLPNAEAVPEALRIINDIGLQYLRDAFNPDLVAQAVVPLDFAKSTNEKTGRIDRKAAFDALSQWRDIHGKVLTEAHIVAASYDRDREKVLMIEIEAADRPAAMRMQRGPQRRKKERKIVKGEDRRKRKIGRRASDDPRNGASW